MGKHQTEEAKRKISVANKGKILGPVGPNCSWWKGDRAGYEALHDWVRKYKPKLNYCEKCGKEKLLELSNISGEYKRDVNDYEWLCRSCHIKKDRVLFWSRGIYPSLVKMQLDGG